MAATLLDLSEGSDGPSTQGFDFSGWGFVNNVRQGIMAYDPGVTLIPGLLTTKHTAPDIGVGEMRSDALYGQTPAPGRPFHDCPAGSSRWVRLAIQTDQNYVPTDDGTGRPRFNLLFDFHGGITIWTPIALCVNAATNMVNLDINGGSQSNPTGHNVDMFPFIAGEVLDVIFFVKTASDNTGRTICKIARNGGTRVTYVDYTGPNMGVGDSGNALKIANYSAGNGTFPTKVVWHSGAIMADTEAELVVPAKGTKKVGYLDGSGVPIVGGTSNTKTAFGTRGSKFTMPEDGTITHLAAYMDFLGTAGQIQGTLAIYSDSAGSPGTKLGQARLYYRDGADTDGWFEYPLAREVQLNAGTVFWIVEINVTGATLVNWRGDSVGTGTFYSANLAGWAQDGQPSPAPANATGNANRTMSMYALYRPTGITPPPPAPPSPAPVGNTTFLLQAKSNKPGASTITLVDGDADTGYRYMGADFGLPQYDKTYSGQRGTQGARLASATAQNRLSTWRLQVIGSDHDDLEEKLSVLWKLDDELRRFGGRVTWRQAGGGYKMYFDVLDSGVSADFGSTPRDDASVLFWQHNRLNVTLGVVSAPYLLGDSLDISDAFASDSLTGGDYTVDAGASIDLAVTGGLLSAATNLGTEKRLVHTGRGYSYSDQFAWIKATPGATITSFKAGVVFKRVAQDTYLEVYVDDNGTNSRLRLDKVVGGTRTNWASSNLGSRVANGVPFWVRVRFGENDVVADYFTAAPTPMATPTTTFTWTLTGGDASLFGGATIGRTGIVWIPQHASATIDDFTVQPYSYRNLTLPDVTRLKPAIPGDVAALAELVVTPSGGSAAPIWALAGWWQRVASHNRLWNGDFESSYLGTAGWSVAAVANINSAATSITRVSTWAKYGGWSGQIVCPATAGSGANFPIYRRFRRGITYTVEAWVHAATATTNVNIRIGNSAANDVAVSGNTALSSAAVGQRIMVTWTPIADYDVAHLAITIAAATASTFEVDGVMVYEGTVAPVAANQTEGRGAYPPVGLLEAEAGVNTPASLANYRGGLGLQSTAGSLTGVWAIDPALLIADDYTQSELAIEVWGRLQVDAAFAPVLYAKLSATPLTSTGVVTAARYSVEYGTAGKSLVLPSGGIQFRFVRLGTLLLPTNLGRWRLTLQLDTGGPSPSATIGIDYLILVPSRRRAASPSGKVIGGFPTFVNVTSEATKRIRSDLSGTIAEPAVGTPEVASNGLGGTLLELPTGDIDALVKLSSLVPDNPTLDSSSEQLAHSATVHVAVTPRWYLARSSA